MGKKSLEFNLKLALAHHYLVIFGNIICDCMITLWLNCLVDRKHLKYVDRRNFCHFYTSLRAFFQSRFYYPFLIIQGQSLATETSISNPPVQWYFPNQTETGNLFRGPWIIGHWTRSLQNHAATLAHFVYNSSFGCIRK